jgi:acyl dehydratase
MLKYSIETFNDAEQSENRIHSDEMAQQLGFKGALVGGVVVFGHMTYLPVKSAGRDWLTGNSAEVRFLKPAYDGEMLDLTFESSESGSDSKCFNPDGDLLATLTDEPGALQPDARHNLPATDKAIVREEISWDSLVLDDPAPAYLWHADEESNRQLTAQLRDDLEIYQGSEACVHPFWMLRQCNSAFSRSFILPAWIHVGSKMTFHRPLLVGQDIEVRMIPISKWERKGHEFTTLYIVFLVNNEVFVEVEHTSIFSIAPP